ncbi:hypothetical protein JCM11251_002097 [Rhodosporidiobolus azoricus]
MKDKISNANFPTDAEGRVYHVGVKTGQVANRIITVGDPARLHRFKKFLDSEPVPFENSSARGYTVVTGKYKGVDVSLIAIGMGVAMVDFFVREVRAVTTGELAIIRFGSCGSLLPSLRVGSIGVPEAALQISTNYDFYHGGSERKAATPFLTSQPIKADEGLQKKLLSTLQSSVASPTCDVVSLPLHASADCFYASQGRIDANFVDHNETLIDDLLAKNPDCASLEMETAHLLHLSSIAAPLPSSSSSPSASSTSRTSIRSAACHMVFAARRPAVTTATTSATGDEVMPEPQSDFIDPSVVEELEVKVGRACLDAVCGWEMGQ